MCGTSEQDLAAISAAKKNVPYHYKFVHFRNFKETKIAYS